MHFVNIYSVRDGDFCDLVPGRQSIFIHKSAVRAVLVSYFCLALLLSFGFLGCTIRSCTSSASRTACPVNKTT
jgi:hypothetical protein